MRSGLRAPGFGLRSAFAAIALAQVGCAGGCSKDKAAADAAPPALVSGAFEGTVTMHVASAAAHVDEDVTYWVKGTKLRIEAVGEGRPKYWAIVDSFGGHPMLINIADDMHAFTVVDLAADAGRPEAWEHRKLGTIGRAADRDCVDWEAHAPGHTVVACMADERLFDLAGLGTGAPLPMPWLAGMDGFPMRSVEKDDAGRELSRSEVTRVMRGAVAAEELEVPKTYRRIEADNPNVTTGRMRK